MANYKEIVTKAIIGKAKKENTINLSLTPDELANNVLGCWVINHNFNGKNENGKVAINGSFDINVWYSYDNNTKTKVNTKTYTYHELYQVPLKNGNTLNNSSEILVRSLKQPSVTNVEINNNEIELTVNKELGVEIVGDTKIKVSIEELEDEYDEIIDDEEFNIDNELNDNYLDEKEG